RYSSSRPNVSTKIRGRIQGPAFTDFPRSNACFGKVRLARKHKGIGKCYSTRHNYERWYDKCGKSSRKPKISNRFPRDRFSSLKGNGKTIYSEGRCPYR